MKLSEYYQTIADGISVLEEFYAEVERKALQVANPELDSENWSDVLWSVQNSINELRVAKSIHQFERVSKEQMIEIFKSYDDGTGNGKIVIPIDYTVKGCDTLRSIARKYGIEWRAILEYNKITSSDIVTGVSIKVPYPVELTARASKEILVFGDQNGENILGTDLPNELSASAGDIKVLDVRESFSQSINNTLLSNNGDIPFYETFGASLDIGEDYPREAVTVVIQTRIADAISSDPRVKQINVLDVTKDGNKVIASVEIQPMQGEPIVITTA